MNETSWYNSKVHINIVFKISLLCTELKTQCTSHKVQQAFIASECFLCTPLFKNLQLNYINFLIFILLDLNKPIILYGVTCINLLVYTSDCVCVCVCMHVCITLIKMLDKYNNKYGYSFIKNLTKWSKFLWAILSN